MRRCTAIRPVQVTIPGHTSACPLFCARTRTHMHARLEITCDPEDCQPWPRWPSASSEKCSTSRARLVAPIPALDSPSQFRVAGSARIGTHR